MLLTCCFREDKTKKANKTHNSDTHSKGGSIEDVVVVVPLPDNDIKSKNRNKASLDSKKKKRKSKKGNEINQDDVDGLRDVRKTTEVIAELHLQETFGKNSNTNNRHSVGSNGSELLRSNSLCSRQSSIQSNLKSSNGPNRDGSDRRDRKERAPLQREQKRLYKQKSQESSIQVVVTSGIHLNASTATTSSTNASSIPFIDQSPTSYLPQNAPGPESTKLDPPEYSNDPAIRKNGKTVFYFGLLSKL